MSKAEETFKTELAMISDESVKAFTVAAFELVPTYFWTAPCSSTGKYHPRWNQGEGGIVRHTKVATFYALELTRAMPLDKEEVMRTGFGEKLFQDVCVSATMLHDGWKHGPAFTGDLSSIPQGNTECHGIAWAKHIYETIVLPKLTGEVKEPSFRIRAILRGIAGHMGIWTGPANMQFWPQYQKDSVLKKVCLAVHYGDYISSRKPSDEMYAIMEHGR